MENISPVLLDWFYKNRRSLPFREDPTPYHVWLSEVMLQQTRVSAVLPYYYRFLEELPDIPALAACGEEKLHKLWEGLGYYSRVRNLQKAAKLVCAQYGGQLPADYAALRALPGIGEYTAGAIASISFGLPVPAVDGNVLRVFSRLYNDPGVITEPAVKKAFTARVMEHQPPEKAGDYNQALMELGALVCVPNGAPLCGQCPLAEVCLARAAGTTAQLPQKAKPKPRKLVPVTLALVESPAGFLVQQRPEKGLLRLRAGMGLYANNRPAKIWPQLAPASPLKPEIVAQGIDFIIVRELIGGVYFGQHQTHTLENGEKQAVDTMPYAEHEIERIGRIGFETARKRRKKLCCVDKANVLDTSRLWRTVMHRLQAEYPDVEYSEMFVDNCAMQIVKNPAQFDVIVTENMFGDILSDEASMITGSIGMIPSSSLGDGTRGLYEPIHGSAPDIAGKDIVNPTACILSAAMMLRYSFGMAAEADAIENAVSRVLDKGLRTADNMSDGCTCLGCTAMGDAILAEL